MLLPLILLAQGGGGSEVPIGFECSLVSLFYIRMPGCVYKLPTVL